MSAERGSNGAFGGAGDVPNSETRFVRLTECNYTSIQGKKEKRGETVVAFPPNVNFLSCELFISFFLSPILLIVIIRLL